MPISDVVPAKKRQGGRIKPEQWTGIKSGIKEEVMKYWSNVFAMAGAACIAVAFINASLFSFFWGGALAYVGYRLS